MKGTASTARVASRAAELMVEYPDVSVTACLEYAIREELLMYGDPDAPEPRGVLTAMLERDDQTR